MAVMYEPSCVLLCTTWCAEQPWFKGHVLKYIMRAYHVINGRQLTCFAYFLFIRDHYQPSSTDQPLLNATTTTRPPEVVKLMMSHHLLCELDHKIILEAPLDHIKNCYILEHVRHMEASDVLKFIDILKEIPDQKHLWITLTDGETLQSVKYYCPLHTYVHICIMGSSVRQVNKAFDYLSIIIFSIIVIVILWLLQ